MKVLAIILLATVLLVGVAMAQQDSSGTVMGQLDALKLRLNNVSDRLGPELIHVQTTEYRVYEEHANITPAQRLAALAEANGAIAGADRYDSEINGVEQGLNAVASQYRPTALSRVNGTIAEGKMLILRTDIASLRNNTASLRLSADRIRQMA